MRSEKLLTAILVFIVSASAAASIVSLSNVASATHEVPTVSIDRPLVKENTPFVFTLTVKNEGGDPIQDVLISTPAGWTAEIKPVVEVPKDNVVELFPENVITLAAGEEGTLKSELENLELAENTDVIRVEGSWVWIPATGDNALLMENALVEIIHAENIGLGAENKIKLVSAASVSMTTDNKVILLQATRGENTGDENVKFPEVTGVKTNSIENVTLGAENSVSTVEVIPEVVLPENAVRVVKSVSVKKGGAYVENLAAGTVVWLVSENATPELLDNVVCDNVVALKVGTPGKLKAECENIEIAENTEATLAANTEVHLADETMAITLPEKWTYSANRWTTDNADYMITAGTSKEFPFASTSPAEGGIYPFTVTTTDNVGEVDSVRSAQFTITVDNVAPAIPATGITASPDPAKGEIDVTITLVASEVISKPENVMVCENQGENFQIADTLTTTDNITWTGTYTTGDNWMCDGPATIYVIGEGYVDAVGHIGSDNQNTFTIDRCLPRAIWTVPTDENTRNSSYVVDNNKVGNAVDNVQGSFENKAGLLVELSLNGAVVESTTSSVGGWFSMTTILSEGPNELGVKFTDEAGNVGPENTWTVFLDRLEPTVSVTSIANLAFVENIYITDRTPTVVMEIIDPGFAENTGLGIPLDNIDIDLLDNTGAEVRENLENATAWEFSGTFENTIPELPAGENYYILRIRAWDVVNNYIEENFGFWLDTVKPDPPSTPTTTPPGDWLGINKNKIYIAGSAEPNSTVNVYGGPNGTTFLDNTDADEDGYYGIYVTLPEGPHIILLTATDAAGNESETRRYGTVMTTVDLTAPKITIKSPATGYSTTKTTVLVQGTATEVSTVNIIISPWGTIKDIPVVDNHFEYAAPLSEGMNAIRVTGTDDALNIGYSDTILVERKVTPWATYAAVIAIIAIILAAIAVLRRRS